MYNVFVVGFWSDYKYLMILGCRITYWTFYGALERILEKDPHLVQIEHSNINTVFQWTMERNSPVRLISYA